MDRGLPEPFEFEVVNTKMAEGAFPKLDYGK